MNRAAHKLLIVLVIGLSLAASAAYAGQRPPRGGGPGRQGRPRQLRPKEDRRGGRHLTPEQRQKLRRRLMELREKPPRERRRFSQNFEKWQKMSPEERHQLREKLQRLRQLPPEKRLKLRERIQRWREMTPEERARLRERWDNMSPEERRRIRERWNPSAEDGDSKNDSDASETESKPAR